MTDAQERRRPRDDEFQMPSLRLDGRVALVTGGSRGLGLGMALALAHVGADIALAARTVEQLDNAAAMIRALGRKVITIPTDVSKMDQVRAMVRQTADHYGRLDVLVNVAGINIRKNPADFTEADWDELMTINLKSVFFACQAA
ncbi:MAG: SDR family NAD(P)-dependent oxidoreductase, partial [Anaerolineae bacterium]|nr:SDR family NAD(P)-dependent oxidoreductase [Anaerolineae bacterium]